MVFSRIYTTSVIIRDSSWTTVSIKNSEAITLQMAAAAGIIQKPLYPCMGREVSQPYHFLFFTGLQEIFQTRQLNLLCDKITKDRQCSQTEGLWLTRHHSNRRYISFKHNWSGWRHSLVLSAMLKSCRVSSLDPTSLIILHSSKRNNWLQLSKTHRKSHTFATHFTLEGKCGKATGKSII